jgi:hypothetical protein
MLQLWVRHRLRHSTFHPFEGSHYYSVITRVIELALMITGQADPPLIRLQPQMSNTQHLSLSNSTRIVTFDYRPYGPLRDFP